MSYDVWISTQAKRPEHSPAADDGSWQRVGELDIAGPNEIKTAIAKRDKGIGAKDYFMADPSVPWVADVHRKYPGLKRGFGLQDATERFWVAVSIGVSGGHMYLVTTHRAKLTATRHNPRETHAGLRGYVPTPIKIVGSKQHGAFEFLT